MARQGQLKLPADSPRVQADKKAIWNEFRSPEMADFFTVGYTGRSIEEFVAILTSAGVATLIDVRDTPVSMYKPDFSKRNLRRHLEAAGIEYLHLRHLGVPRDIRARAIESRGRDVIWDWYDANVVTQFIARNLTEFLNIADHPVALMCVELDPMSCHRHRLSIALERRGLDSFDL